MSWNESGNRDDKNKRKDPWGNRPEEGPPNIDEALRQLQRKLRALFGQNGTEGPTNFTLRNSAPSHKKMGLAVVGGVLLLGYFVSGIYIVQPAEEAVVLRFGHYVDTQGPGPHWIAPFIESKEILNVQEVKTTKHGGQMLTKDENIVSAELAVQYRISNARDYLFNLVDPQNSLRQVSDSALRAVVGQSSLNEVLTSGRSEITAEISKQIQETLNNYRSGLEISDVAMQQTKAPEEVKGAFDDAIKAQQDEERLVNQAQAYSQKIVPIAEGRAKRVHEEARAYKERSILEAQGKTAKFSEILPEYKKAPQLTRERLYIDTLQQVYANTPKVIVDVNGGNNLVYLPLDKLMNARPATEARAKDEEESSSVSMSAGEKSASGTPSTERRFPARPSYEDAERPNRENS